MLFFLSLTLVSWFSIMIRWITKSFECTIQLWMETIWNMYLLNICWSTVCSLFNYFYTKTRCQETLFSFILKTLSSSLFASMFCQSILLMSASPLLLFRQPAWCMIRITFHIKKKSGKYTEKCFPLAFAALHLRYYCSFWVFYAGSSF